MNALRGYPTGHYLRWIARAWGTTVIAAFAIAAIIAGAPRTPEAAGMASRVQLVLLLVAALGVLIAWCWQLIGGAILTAAAVGLGVVATVGYHPIQSFFVCLAFLIPGILFIISRRDIPTRFQVLSTAAAMVIALAAGGIGAAQLYNYYYGPTHTESTLKAAPIDLVVWIWSGALTDRSAVVNAKLARDSSAVRLALSRNADMSDTVYSDHVAAGADNGRVISIPLTGLEPRTTYYYAVEDGGHIDLSRQGRFRTFAGGPFSFSFAFASCARTGSNGSVFDAIRALAPDFFLGTGDFFYGDIGANDRTIYRANFDRALTAPAQAALYRGLPIAYMWDDHDYGTNNSDVTSPSREAARLTYRQYVPHYPLPAGPGNAPIYQAFTAGRVRFILTDLRSERTPNAEPDGPAKTMLGPAQKEWLKRELLVAADKYPLIVWVSSVPWIGEATAGEDHWGGFATERRELADFIAANHIKGVVLLAGDAHMLAIDDGTHSDYATSGGAPITVMQAGALDRPGSVKGGPYSIAPRPGGGQFGLMTVTDDGGVAITVTLSGRNWAGEEIMQHRFTVPAGSVAVKAGAP